MVDESKIIETLLKSDKNAKISSLVRTRTNGPGLPTSSPRFEQPSLG